MAIELQGQYQALARKYRPQTFEDVVGQEHVINALMNSIEQQRIHHAYLLTGTRGIGKTTIARKIAQLYAQLLEATAALQQTAKNSRGISNKDLAAFTDQVRTLLRRWS